VNLFFLLPHNLKKTVKKIKKNKKPTVIVSGINLDSGGTLSIYNDVLYYLSQNYSNKYDIYAFCSSKNKKRFKEIEYVEFYWSKKSYLIRILLEKCIFFQFSKFVKIKLWLSMHDITPRVRAKNIVTYAHNPAPFYKFKLSDFYFSPTFSLFILFYKYLYSWDIEKNKYLVVQQFWMKKKFDMLAPNVHKIVSKPIINREMYSEYNQKINGKKIFFYPTLSRPFKKIEDFLRIAEFFYRLNIKSIDFYITLSGKETKYSRWLYQKFSYLPNVVWLGQITRKEVFKLYKKATCLIFTSHLETWGLPLTEFSLTNKTIIAPDLPYVRETLVNYPKLALYKVNNIMQLLDLSLKVANESRIHYSLTSDEYADHPTANGWENLIPLIIE